MPLRRLLLALLVTLTVVGLLAPPASAGSPAVTVADPAGDGTGAGDIRGMRLGGPDGRLVIQIRTAQPIDLDTAPAWTEDETSNTQLRFNLEVDEDPAIDYVVFVEPGMTPGNGARLQSFQPMPSPEGTCAIIGQPQLTIIRVRVAFSCIDDATEIRSFARYRFDRGGNGSINSNDRAPNAGFMDYVDD